MNTTQRATNEGNGSDMQYITNAGGVDIK